MTANISKIRDERLTEDEKMELIADYLENGGGGSSKFRVKVKVDYVPTTAAEIMDMSVMGAMGYAYAAMTGVSFEDADGEPVSAEDVAAAAMDGNIELISIDHLGDLVVKNGDAVTVQPMLPPTASLAASCLAFSSESGEAVYISGHFWMVEVGGLPFLVQIDPDQGQLAAIVGVAYQQ